MRKYFVFIVLVLPIYAMGENVIFNPGFDMTPWDTGWTIETDTATSGSCASRVAQAQADTDIGSSLPNCCRLKTYVGLSSSGWCGGRAYAETKVYQIFNEIPSCLIKAQIKYFWSWNASMCGWIDTATVDVQINGIWQTVWGKSCENDTNWSEVSIGVNDTITGIMFHLRTLIDCSSIYGASLSFCFWVDDVSINEVGIEESKELEMKSEKLKAFPNPFINGMKIRDLKLGNIIQVYDMTGRLVEETKENIIGKNLPPGFYFVKIKGYKPIKVIKLGCVK
ncbi:MAG: T9SS type A sorting domain-containing protein [Candidatus Stahlbacteria bacterium]|nr:T9SS type A sorting domain-containing protein [Candidatus Stahlbacteria bacterium]